MTRSHVLRPVLAANALSMIEIVQIASAFWMDSGENANSLGIMGSQVVDTTKTTR